MLDVIKVVLAFVVLVLLVWWTVVDNKQLKSDCDAGVHSACVEYLVKFRGTR